MDEAYARIALAEDLHLTWDRHLVTVASSRWEPGIHLYDVEYLTIEVKPHKGRMKILLGSRGAHFNHQALRFDLDEPAYRRFEGFIARVRNYRDWLREAR